MSESAEKPGSGGAGDDDESVIHPRWETWVAENLARGATRDEVVEALVEEGVDPAIARRCALEIGRSPGLAAARAAWHRSRALEQVIRLHRQLREPSQGVVRKPLPDADTFIAEHWVAGVPAIFTDVVTAWPAFGRWSPTDFVERFGEVEVEACVGRTDVANPDADWSELAQTMPMRELVGRIVGGRGNDTYVIAKNGLLRRADLSTLLAEIVLPATHFDQNDPLKMALWFGPAGTHTPLHHDGDNALLCQVVGKKRLRLAAPESLALLDRSDGVYCEWDPKTRQDLADGPADLTEVMLEPGEALFIPAGWWHQVDALELSMTVSAQTFRWPNDFGWYKPGTALRGRAPPSSSA